MKTTIVDGNGEVDVDDYDDGTNGLFGETTNTKNERRQTHGGATKEFFSPF